MTNTKLIIVAVVVIVVSVFASYLLAPKIQTVVQTIQSPPIGGVATNYFDIGGVRHYTASMDLKTSTTTICRLQSPVATSTLVFASVDIKTASSSATIIDIAKTSNASSYATTTLIGTEYALAASTGVTIIASTTPTLGITRFTPNDWLVVKMEGGITAPKFSPTGSCKAEWIQMSN